MVHKSSLIPGLSRFIDENVLAHYPATSMKRILMAGAVSLYIKKNEGLVDTLASNPLFSGLGVVGNNGLIDIELVRDTIKKEVQKAGFMRLSVPMVGDVDFTVDDIDALYRFIIEANTQSTNTTFQSVSTDIPNGGIY